VMDGEVGVDGQAGGRKGWREGWKKSRKRYSSEDEPVGGGGGGGAHPIGCVGRKRAVLIRQW
jgi:hypothetical protein